MEDHAELEWYTCKNITRICWKNITNSPKEWKKKNLTGINFFINDIIIFQLNNSTYCSIKRIIHDNKSTLISKHDKG